MKKIIICTLILVTGIFSYIKFKGTNKIKYSKYRVEKNNFKDFIQADGKIYPLNIKKIFIDQPLKIEKLFYKKGDFVKKGDLIMTFDSSKRNQLFRKLKKVEINKKIDSRKLKEQSELLKLGGSTQTIIDDLSSTIKKEDLDIEQYNEDLNKLVKNIKSPFTGTILTMEGEVNYRVNTEKELLTIADLSNVEAKLFIPEYNLEKIKIGSKVKIFPEAYQGKEFLNGTILKLPTLSSNDSTYLKSNEAYVEVEVTLDKKARDLKPGFTVRGEILRISKKDIITVPKVAIQTEKDKKFVFRIDKNNKIHKVYIIIGDSNLDISEVKKGLNIDDLIIQNPESSLVDGSIVKISN